MKISEIKNNSVFPFEDKNEKQRLIFSFFLHKAPKIDSNLALKIDIDENKIWNKYIEDWNNKNNKKNKNNKNNKNYQFYKSEFPKESTLANYKLAESSTVTNTDKGFVCLKENKRKEDKEYESDYRCFTRHLRNAIAHGHVYILEQKNRKFFLFEDYNRNKKTAIMLLTKDNLIKLKQEIEKIHNEREKKIKKAKK